MTATITVPLIPKTEAAMDQLKARNRLSTADLVNRALQLLDAVEAEQESGSEVLVRRRDGSTYVLHLL